MTADLILGINAYHADAAACVVREGKLIAAAEDQFFYLLVGSTSAVLTILILALLNTLIAFEAAVAISQVFGMTFAFILNRFFVFRGYKVDGRSKD